MRCEATTPSSRFLAFSLFAAAILAVLVLTLLSFLLLSLPYEAWLGALARAPGLKGAKAFTPEAFHRLWLLAVSAAGPGVLGLVALVAFRSRILRVLEGSVPQIGEEVRALGESIRRQESRKSCAVSGDPSDHFALARR